MSAEKYAYSLARFAWRGIRTVPGVGDFALFLFRGTPLLRRMGKVLHPDREGRGPDFQTALITSVLKPEHTDAAMHTSTFGQSRPYPHPREDYFEEIEAVYRERRAAPDAYTRVAVISAVTGGYESAQRHENLMPDTQYVLVTDGTANVAGGVTEIAPLDYFDIDPVRMARFVKTHPYLYAPEAKVLIWTDSNIVIRGDLTSMIREFLQSGKSVGAIQHPLRTSVFDEGRECIKRAKDDPDAINRQLKRYQKLGFDTDEMVESNFLLLRNDRDDTRKFLSLWWNEIERGSRRDQLSINFAAKAAGLKFHWITERPHSVRNHPLLALIHHDANGQQETKKPAAVRRKSFSRTRDKRIAASGESSADIVICVHNAPEVTQACLESVRQNTTSDKHRIIIVDDGSAPKTARLVAQFCKNRPNTISLRHPRALGYTKAANAGVAQATADFVLLLNSDTIVSPNFMEKMIDAVQSAPGAGIVGPLSNAASTQSLPDHQSSAGQTAVNALPAGMAPADMDLWCENQSKLPFPRTALVHGFCFGMTRAAIDAVGPFDEANFPNGYGEENDFCFRAAAAGIGLVIATNTYVFHAKSQSYEHSVREKIVARSNQRNKDLHGADRVRRAIINLQKNPSLEEIRKASRKLYISPVA